MGSVHALRNRVVDSPNSLAARSRTRRWEWLRATFPNIEAMSIIDLGGTAEAWERAPIRPATVHVVNLETPPADVPEWICVSQADACDLPGDFLAGMSTGDPEPMVLYLRRNVQVRCGLTNRC